MSKSPPSSSGTELPSFATTVLSRAADIASNVSDLLAESFNPISSPAVFESDASVRESSNVPSVAGDSGSQDIRDDHSSSPEMPMSNGSASIDIDEAEDDTHDVEPKFKYERLFPDRNIESANILFRDSATALAVHPKLLALGTKNGEIHILDLQGNRISLSVPVPKHAGPVNDISLDEAGDYMASAGDDGKVFVHGLYHTDDNYQVKHSEPVKTVAICPNFTAFGLSVANKSMVFGSRQLILCEKRFLGTKLTTLDPGDGRVTRIKWFGNFLAWGNRSGVKVMDMKEKQVIGLIPKDQRDDGNDYPNKCEIFWMDSRTLLVAWPHVFSVCAIRDRRKLSNSSLSSGGLTKLPNFELVINKLIHTEFAIAGIGPYVEDQFVLLGYNIVSKEDDKKVQMRIVRPKWEEFEDVTCDELPLRGALYATYEDYKLQSLPEDGLYFIVSPKDVVVAKPLDLDDVIDWLLERGRHEEAMKVAGKNNGRTLVRHNIRDIGRQYVDYLRLKDNYEEAARVCPKVLGKDRIAWEEQVAEFYRAGKLRILAPYMPRSADFQLTPGLYELVLASFLQDDHEGFLRMVKEWPATLYNVQAIINSVIEFLLRDPNQKVLLESLTTLYTLVEQYDKALKICVKLKHPDVFELINKRSLYKTIVDQQLLVALMDIDAEQTVRLLTDNNERIPIASVVTQLQSRPQYLLQYLDRLFQMNKTIGKEYHDIQARLYAEYEPKKLLHFMQNSKHFMLNTAFEVCEKKNMFPEMVYLLSRMGR
ncbi:vacuolar protein sorting-associated protein 41 homolog isoform X1 [Paramacrobiotus metropolitanus]|uniref:vacuolar protein sorting-associated protein 41 homolog isoform X1 n=1 Tax=Paramacrobiotus metropolitanus TaxID=2943436 RepID=UPI002445625E|nr:vacuolar protein sorting-associated protein 41 homolog isoform X1 [Paramacrobiotus metropolitanus]XP_055328704.1 vacuolar protein sorting-associated protein 41 homolog isoform X1 [Paramacrobiotus metropolitanus]XP_055328705.1 vacuolar protein sorting-associated protein 41 homolog isoform X1 [Paramacrobiotus metropolitanus]XP_055328706.1 vacuolar protein sorting-associated protein 41 homolog isoform X1 [Paramacrobiotus metropolitanus]XP_055328707.1 vacuolar protein sorting-associated protein 